MSGGYAIEVSLLHSRLEKFDPRRARLLFQIAVHGELRLAYDRGPTEQPSLLTHKLRIGARFLAAQSMIQMQHGEGKVPLGSHFVNRCSRHIESAPPDTATPMRAPRVNML